MLIPLPSPTRAHLHLLRKPYEELLTNSWMHKHTRRVRARTHIHAHTRKNKETLVSPRENKELLPSRGESLLKLLNWSYLLVSVKVPLCFFLKLCVKSQVFLQHFTQKHNSQWIEGQGAESRLFEVSITRFPRPLPSQNSGGFLRGLHASHRSSCRRGAYGGLNRLDVASPLITVR